LPECRRGNKEQFYFLSAVKAKRLYVIIRKRGEVMTTTEILQEIQKMPINEKRRVLATLNDEIAQTNAGGNLSDDETERREREFEREMLAKGHFSHIPPRKMTDAEFEDFEPLEIEGEPLSEQIIRERR